MKYICETCGYVYDEEAGYPIRKINPGTAFADLPEDFACPGCGSDKDGFYAAAQKQTVSAPSAGQSWEYVKYSDHTGESDR